jgi:hypothetical protein
MSVVIVADDATGEQLNPGRVVPRKTCAGGGR